MTVCSDDKKYLYKNVRRWTNKLRLERWGQPSEKVTECDKLIIPVHLGCHWTCAVISLRDQEILYFDSLGVRLFCPFPVVTDSWLTRADAGTAASWL